MKRTCVFAFVAAVMLACTAPLYAQPERDALQMVPDDALGFVIVNRLGETNDKLGDMTKRMQIPLPLKPIDFIKLITGDHPGFAPIPRPVSALRQRTAVLMPVHNEPVDATFGRVEAMARSSGLRS